MNDQLSLLTQTTCADSLNATSSPASAAGPTHCGSQDGQTPNLSGLEAAPASRSPALGADAGQKTLDIFGRNSDGSSPSADLQECLGNKLRQRLAGYGSLEYALTWRTWDIPWGPPICALRALGHRISGNGCTGWPTQRAEAGGARKQCRGFLEDVIQTVGWPTPRQTDWKCGGTYTENCSGRDLTKDATLASWPTPNAMEPDGNFRPSRAATGRTTDCLGRVARSTMEAKPRATDAATSGPTPAGTNASTEKPGAYRLNLRFSLWLQGFPAEWACCGERATLSCRQSRQSS